MTGVLLLIFRILAVIALYTFLGVSLYYLWVSIKQDTHILEINENIEIDLIIKAGTDEEKNLHFKKVNIEIGRDENCDLVLNHSTVSNRHARISYHHGHWWLDDLLSTNGTKINGEIVKNPTIVINGDIISCGQINLSVKLQDESNIFPGEIE